MASPSIYIVAGEPSGDVLGAKLMHALNAKNPDASIHGVGGVHMENAGLTSLFPMSDLSVMGFTEILPHIFTIKKRLSETIADITSKKPDVVITIDSPGFNKRLAKKIKHLNIPLVHYVAPTVWAYKPKRAATFAELFDHLLLLLPFEPPYFDAAGLNNTFIGHPIVEDETHEQPAIDAWRQSHNIEANTPLLLIMPGSRKREVNTLLPIYQETVAQLASSVPDLQTVTICLPHLASHITSHMSAWPCSNIVISDVKEKSIAMAACDIGLIKSGTSSLEAAYQRVPHVIAYKVNPISAWLVRKMIRISFVNLINIMKETMVVPEFLQERCEPEAIARALEGLLNHKHMKELQLNAMSESFALLRENQTPSPSEKAAEVALAYAKSNQKAT